MAKYRLLSREELQELEKEFINYLILNGITAEDWEKLKKEENEKAEEVIELFSDVVFVSIMRKSQYLDFFSSKEIRTYHCLSDKLVIVGMQASQDSGVDFTDATFIREALSNPPEGIKLFTSEMDYKQQREIEMFRLTEKGCTISDGKLFKTLCLALASGK